MQNQLNTQGNDISAIFINEKLCAHTTDLSWLCQTVKAF